MRILDIYIGRFTYLRTSTAFITLPVVVGIWMSSVMRFIEQVKGN